MTDRLDETVHFLQHVYVWSWISPAPGLPLRGFNLQVLCPHIVQNWRSVSLACHDGPEFQGPAYQWSLSDGKWKTECAFEGRCILTRSLAVHARMWLWHTPDLESCLMWCTRSFRDWVQAVHICMRLTPATEQWTVHDDNLLLQEAGRSCLCFFAHSLHLTPG